MKYISTRNKNVRVSAAEAIAQGLSREGGLFVPEVIPALAEGAIEALCGMNYAERAVYIMKTFLEDFSVSELADFASRAYGPRGFDSPAVAPVRGLDGKTHFLELWHGPTCAFKDMALQMLPYLLTASMKKTGEGKDVCILVATSGDTGKAALEGFRDVDRTKIMVFYPENGVSDVQKLQMTSQEGSNVSVCAVRGNFDDAQSGVKMIFSDVALRAELAEKGWFLSSANSINWGRLLPQIVYYISAYCDLINSGSIKCGDEIDFCVPTGNFGDILAGYYAKKMGLPVGKLICASNRNDVLTEFFTTGVYDRRREFYETISPSMDILISSNLERLLFDLSGDSGLVASFMSKLTADGRYEIGEKMLREAQRYFTAESCSDAETKQVIADTFRENGYLIDTHTAVAYGALKKYREKSGTDRITVVVSTASPFKFTDSVLDALGEGSVLTGPELIDRLSEVTGVPAPRPLAELKNKMPRFSESLDKSELTDAVRRFLG